jgi:transposase
VSEIPEDNQRLKRLSRRRRELVEEKVGLQNRMRCDLMSVCPDLLAITASSDNLWFLRLLSCREDLRQLAHLRPASLLRIKGVGKKRLEVIRAWQRRACFSPEVSWVGPMIIADARRILELLSQISSLEKAMGELCASSQIARRLLSIPGFGEVSAAELAGEIGARERFASEASLALYLGMCPLDRRSGEYRGSRAPRQVNKRARKAMMNTLFHHVEHVPQSRRLYERKRAEGKSHNQALRVVGRQLVRVIWCLLREGRDYEIR